MTVMKISRIGDVAGIALPDDVLSAAHAKPGDEMFVTVTETGIIQIAPVGSSSAEQLEKARELAQRYRNALRELAK